MNISQPGGSESDGALLSPQKQTVGAAAFPLDAVTLAAGGAAARKGRP